MQNCLFSEPNINTKKKMKMGNCMGWVRPQASILSPTAVKRKPLGKRMSVTPVTDQLYTEVQGKLGFFWGKDIYTCISVKTYLHTHKTHIYIYIHTLTHFCIYGCNRDSCFKILSVSGYELSLPRIR